LSNPIRHMKQFRKMLAPLYLHRLFYVNFSDSRDPIFNSMVPKTHLKNCCCQVDHYPERNSTWQGCQYFWVITFWQSL